MTNRRWLFRSLPRAGLLLAGLGMGLARCGSDAAGPNPDDPRNELDLNVIRLPANAPPFYGTSVSFYAKVGQEASGFLYFQDQEGKRGEKFAELKIPSDALLARPDGTPFAAGDSVLITMQVGDPARLLVELQPSGIQFRGSSPAELKLEYGEAGDDLNHDGRVDGEDDEIEQRLAIWRQEQPGDPFVRVGTVKLEDENEVEAKLSSFSRYAIAY